jgi:uncharacterized protein YndB with AHSA1/START domain
MDIFFYVFGGLLGLIALLLLVAAIRPSDFRIARSLLVAAPPEKIFPWLNSPKKFHEWSPYREKDLSAKNEFSGPEAGPGAIFHWSGNGNVGEGYMRFLEQDPNRSVKVDLEFLKPFAGHNLVEFSLESQREGTIVTWAMTGKFSFMPRLVSLFINMDKMIGDDFAKGLEKLKSQVE